jgi:regulator of sigma E protease
VGLVPNSPAEKSGILAGDTIEKIQTGTTMFDTRTLNTDHQSDAVRNFIAAHQDESMIFIVQRQGSNGIEEKNFLAKPVAGLIAGQPDKKAVGVELDDVGVLQLPVHLALVQGAMLGWDMTQSTALGLATFFKQIVTGTANFAGVAGPIGITAFGAAALKQGFAAGIFLTALISINLALINLIPIPGLDGGRLLIIAIEGVTKKRLPTPVLGALTLAGFALLILLMLVVSYHDIAKLVG